MPDFISDSRFTQALRICCWAACAGMAISAQMANSEEISFARDLKILTIQPAYSGADWLFPYQVKSDIVLAHPEKIAPAVPRFGNTLRLSLVAEPKEEGAWSTNARWQIAPNKDRASLTPSLRLESNEEQFEFKPRRNSIWAVWRKALHF